MLSAGDNIWLWFACIPWVSFSWFPFLDNVMFVIQFVNCGNVSNNSFAAYWSEKVLVKQRM